MDSGDTELRIDSGSTFKVHNTLDVETGVVSFEDGSTYAYQTSPLLEANVNIEGDVTYVSF